MTAIKVSTPDAEAVAKALGGAKRHAAGWVARCPAHDDNDPSLRLDDRPGGGLPLWTCDPCGPGAPAVTAAVLSVLKARGMIGGNGNGCGGVPARTVRHEYREAAGELKLTVVRKLGPNGKTKRKPDGKGKEITREPKGVKGPYPLYNLSAVLAADPEKPILCFEGELKADVAQAAWPAAVVTTTVGGAGKARHTDFGPFKGKKVWFVSDDNKPGRAHALECAERSAAAGAVGARVGLAEGDTGLDVHDWLLADLPDVVAKRIENLVNPLSWHRDRDPEPQEAMKLADANGRPALVAVEGGGQPEGATEATGFAPLPRRDKASLESALSQLGIDVQYNLRTSSHEWNRGGGWAPANDRVDDDIRELIAASFKIAHNERPALYGRERWVTSLNSILHGREVDPFRTWIEALPAWDKVERLSTWLGRAFRTNDDALSRWCSRYVFLGAVERTYKPGSKLDVLPVLGGAAGCRQVFRARPRVSRGPARVVFRPAQPRGGPEGARRGPARRRHGRSGRDDGLDPRRDSEPQGVSLPDERRGDKARVAPQPRADAAALHPDWHVERSRMPTERLDRAPALPGGRG